jgi:hypothetical protein
MKASDFEILTRILQDNPGTTARELSAKVRAAGHSHFTPKLVNQLLYRLLATEIVQQDGSGEKPRWSTSTGWQSRSSVPRSKNLEKRPLNPQSSKFVTYKIADTEIRLLEDESMSPNDPYLLPDWIGSHIVVSLNTNHPFWQIRLTIPTDRALYRMIAAIDAYVQWKVARLTEPPDATEVKNLRDYALRFCTLVSTEISTND